MRVVLLLGLLGLSCTRQESAMLGPLLEHGPASLSRDFVDPCPRGCPEGSTCDHQKERCVELACGGTCKPHQSCIQDGFRDRCVDFGLAAGAAQTDGGVADSALP